EVDVFGGVAQRCAAGGEYPQVGHSGQEVVDDGGDPVDEMFAVVEDEQIRSRAQGSDDAAAQIRAGGVAIDAVDSLSYVEAVGDRAQELIGMADRGQLDDMDAGEVAEPSDLLSKARLSQPARAGNRDQSCRREQPGQRFDVPVAAKEARRGVTEPGTHGPVEGQQLFVDSAEDVPRTRPEGFDHEAAQLIETVESR